MSADELNGVELDVVVSVDAAMMGDADLETLAMSAIGAVRAQLDAPSAGAVSVAILTDDEIQALNRTHRGKDGPTNVLSFPAPVIAGAPRLALGDIALGAGVVAAEAEAAGVPFADRLTHMIAHGYAHLEGFDHQTDAEAAVMEALEARALVHLGIADPYKVEVDG